MKKTVSILTLMALILLVTVAADAQTNLKIRLSGNTTTFLGEPNGDEVLLPSYEAYNTDVTNSRYPFDDFTNQGKLGFEAELMMALTEKAWLGFEVGTSNLKGYNYNPPFYNVMNVPGYYQTALRQVGTTQWIPLQLANPDSMQYSTSMINLLVNLRFYLSTGRFRPFVKLHSGVSFIGTELSYFTEESIWPPSKYNITDADTGLPLDLDDYEFTGPVIYSRGTSTSSEGRWPALNIGAGLGFEFQVNEKISLYAGYTYSMINSDIVDGGPNFDYNDDVNSTNFGKLERFNTFGNTSRISFGLTYSLGEGVSIISGGSKGGKVGGSSGRQHPYLPFYEIKRR
ncbi:outer membrane protein beta-barrel domain [Bacteroidales bacterium 6E]|nr:outer membrane protein beta-barrel domain [Bacteroidales bacterium 6E]